ncbi:hypothetical protein QFC21_003269 [Naganishia friedmannii]|uniref:Uncharacterized protein n=1 Tax=Naganishia friedmannii TaxID=89922 RepID=A0ACC2VQY2_9TREE|nr:hypothetical protein QFC21_003269 [Naganishia friedmannii]
MQPASLEEFEAAIAGLDSIKANDRDQEKVRTLLRRYHAISPWTVGTDIASWIMARHEEVQNDSRKRARSASQQPPPRLENAIEQVEVKPASLPPQQPAAFRTMNQQPIQQQQQQQQQHLQQQQQNQQQHQFRQQHEPPPHQQLPAFKMSPGNLVDSRQSTPPTGGPAQQRERPALVKIERDEPPAVNTVVKAESGPRSSSPDSPPLSALLKPVSAKTQPGVTVSQQIPSTNGRKATPQLASPAAMPFPTRAASVTSISSSVIRQSPAPSPAPGPEQVEDRERRLRQAQNRHFPSPPPSDDESFSVPVRQPFKPEYAEDVNLERRKNFTSVGIRQPDMAWTRSLPQTEVTPPDSPSSHSSASSEDVLVGDDRFDPVGDRDDLASPRPRQPAESSSSANANVAANDGDSDRQSKVGKRSTKEIGSAKGERLSAEQNSRRAKEPVQRKPWELRQFVAPEFEELRKTTLAAKEVIPFTDIQKLLPPVVSGSDSKQLENSFLHLRRLLLPADTKMQDRPRVELALLQVVWLLNQIAEHGSPRYLKAFAADVSNMKLLEFFLGDAWERADTSITKSTDDGASARKSKLTEWRAICVAYFTIKLLRKLNPADELLKRTKVMNRVGEWSRRDDDIRTISNQWANDPKTRLISSVPGAKRKAAADENVTNNKRLRPEVNRGASDQPSTSKTATPARLSVSGGKKTGEDNAMSMFLAPTPASRPARSTPVRKVPPANDALAQAFARLAPAQIAPDEPEPTRKSPDPSRPPRIGKDGKPRPCMSVKWKPDSKLEQIRFIESRSPNEHHDGSARQMEMDEGAALRKHMIEGLQIPWYTPLPMAYRGTPDVQEVSSAETKEQLDRERNVPQIIITDESDIPLPPDETAVREAIVPGDVARIPLYEEEEQAYIPSYQYMQQQENQNRTYNQPAPGTATLPLASTSTVAGPAYNYGWGQTPPVYPANAPNNPTGNPMAIFDPAALQQLQQQLAPRPANVPAQPQYGQSNTAVYNGYNTSIGYNMPNGYDAQAGYNSGYGVSANRSNNWRPAHPAGPARHPDGRDELPRQVREDMLDFDAAGSLSPQMLGALLTEHLRLNPNDDRENFSRIWWLREPELWYRVKRSSD